ncbi:MAG: ABC transporter permease [Deltaproteobacteria bacterium]|nr:ABC transporter permease [Deltaproteobacteria bacterium]
MSDVLLDLLTLAAVALVLAASAWLGHHTAPRRALAVLATALGAMVVVSGLLRVVPGDPAAVILGEQAPAETRQALAFELGLVDEQGAPLGLVPQLGRFVRGAGAAVVLAAAPASTEETLASWLPDEPRSYRTREPVRTVIARRLGPTALLAGSAMLIAVIAGLGLGAAAAVWRGRRVGALAEGLSLLGAAVPRFWLGPLLILVFALALRWLPPSGADAGWRSLVLPAISLGAALAALLARTTRSALLEVLGEDYIRTARAKGLPPSAVVTRHALRAAAVPIVTVIGLQVGGLLAGAIVTEKVFAWPGMGTLLLESIRRLDVPVVQGVVLVTAVGAALATLGVEEAVRVLDPRLRRGDRA